LRSLLYWIPSQGEGWDFLALRDLNEYFKSFEMKISRGVSPKSLDWNKFTANFGYGKAAKVLNEFV